MFKQKTFNFRNTCIKIGLCLLLAACSSSSGSSSTATRPCTTFDCKGMLNNLASNIMLPAINDFKTKSSAMSTAVDAYFAALGLGNEAAKRTAAQDAWKTAMATWQKVEVMQVGPLTDDFGVLRDKIYSWPVTNTCGVDQDVVFADTGLVVVVTDGKKITTDYVLAGRTRDRRGMDALEYVLFNEDLDHSCGADVPEGWTDLTDVKAARANYAKGAAADVALQAQTLKTRWGNATSGFLADLIDPERSGSGFASVETAVNTVSNALFYYEDKTKDIKLAKPLGLKPNDCSETPTNQGCAKEVESPFSQTSKENIKNNLLALQELFLGNNSGVIDPEKPGFAKFLDASEGDSSLLRDRIAKAIIAIDAIPTTLTLKKALDPVSGNYDSVKVAWVAAKEVTDQLKNNFLEVLKLNIPGSTGGDGD